MGGGGTTTTTSQTNSNQSFDQGPWSKQQPFLTAGWDNASNLLKNNAISTPINNNQTQGYNTAASLGAAGSPFMPASNQNATDTLSGKYLDPSSNPWLTDTFNAAAAPVTRAFQTATAPTTDAMFSGNGAYNSSARFNAQGNNNLGLGTTLNNLATSIYGGNYGQERQNQVATQGQVPSLTANQYTDANQQALAGNAQQGLQLQQQQQPWQTAQMYQGLLGSPTGSTGTSSGQTTGTQQTPYSSNTAGQILGGASSIASMALPFFMPFSDVRLKEGIERVGETDDGQNLYLFRYKGDPTPHVGLMAQEVEKRNPDAVVEDPSGYKRVNYDLALGPSIFSPRKR